MKYITLCILVFSPFLSMANQKVAINNSELKQLVIDLMRDHLKDKYYNIEELRVERILDQKIEHAVAINNIWTSEGACFSYLAVTNSMDCPSKGQCKIENKIVDCSDRN